MMMENLRLFLRIVEKSGMSAAGREIGLSPATVSERVAALETHYGVRLLTRTTRSISLTDEGRELVTGARRILAEVDELESRIKLGVEKISGTVHLSVPIDLGRNRIAPLLDEIMEENPNISIDLILSDGYIDLVGQGVDLGIRFGELADSTLIAKRLGDNHRIVCASPEYLKKHGTPQHPDDLEHHNCVRMRFGTQIDSDWRFRVGDKEKNYPVRGDRIANDGELVRSWCRAGHGIALKSEWDIRADLQSGDLVPLLINFAPLPTSIQLVYPAGALQPRRVRLVIDRVVSWFSNQTMTG